MDENLLLIAFAVFVVLMLVVAFVLRRMTVDDIFSDDKTASISEMLFSDKPKGISPFGSQSSNLPSSSSTRLGEDKPAFELNRQNLNKIGKILGAVGAVLIFAPLPDAVDGVGFGIAFLGYLLTRFTNSPKEEKAKTAQSSTADKLRVLASKPEYREALEILAEDMKNPSLTTDSDRRQRAVHHLRSKGVSVDEANQNITLLAGYLKYRKNV